MGTEPLVIVGCDIGQKVDPTAIVVCERTWRETEPERHVPPKGAPLYTGFDLCWLVCSSVRPRRWLTPLAGMRGVTHPAPAQRAPALRPAAEARILLRGPGSVAVGPGAAAPC